MGHLLAALLVVGLIAGCASAEPRLPATLPAEVAPETIPVMTDVEALAIGKAYAESQVIREHQRVLQLEAEIAKRDLSAKYDEINGHVSASADRLKLKQADGWRPDWEKKAWFKQEAPKK
jgi:hypothetical protein